MSYNCKYCNQLENKQLMPGLVCDICKSFVHLSCLQRPGTPGNFEGDIFFDFTCKECSETEIEVFTRNKFPWVNVIFLTLHHLSHRSLCISNNGYFHYKTHISTFIDRNWTLLFGEKSKRKKNWMGTIAGALSVYNNLLFKSGSAFLGEAGWWKLLHSFTPAVAVHILAEVVKDKPKGVHRTQLSMEQRLFIKKVTSCGYGDLLTKKEVVPETPLVPAKKRKLEFDEISQTLGSSYYEMVDSDSRDQLDLLAVKSERIVEQYDDLPLQRNNSYSDMESVFKGFLGNSSEQVVQSESSSVRSYDYTTNDFYDSDSRSRSPHLPSQHSVHQGPSDKEKQPDKSTDKATKSVDKSVVRRENRFSTLPNSVDMPWLEPEPEVKQNMTEMTQYEEVQLLKKVEGLIPKVKDPNKKAYLYRLKGKLALRRLKRQRHLPIFDLDKSVKILGGYLPEEKETAMNAERVLDRFQRSYLLDNLCGTIADKSYSIQLLAHTEAAPFRSTYSNTLLKPYIRRDHETTPLWLKLTDELLRKTNSNVKDYEPPPRATIDYSYVRPHHIAAVNNLCAQFFWPGIDLTEALQYPEMSCIVSYKKIVIGCAFLVPDVGPNEAYIPFVLTRPEWRNAGIATFMLYHLLQTCIGQDVTLHVSPTNTAIFMYQKFGFKTEELVQDFYEKYFDIDYKGCRHALFLRLVR